MNTGGAEFEFGAALCMVSTYYESGAHVGARRPRVPQGINRRAHALEAFFSLSNNRFIILLE